MTGKDCLILLFSEILHSTLTLYSFFFTIFPSLYFYYLLSSSNFPLLSSFYFFLYSPYHCSLLSSSHLFFLLLSFPSSSFLFLSLSFLSLPLLSLPFLSLPFLPLPFLPLPFLSLPFLSFHSTFFKVVEGAIKLSASPSLSTTILHKGIFRIIAVLGKLSKYSPQKDFQMRIEYSSFAVALCQLPFLLSINYPQSPVGYAAYECYSIGK